MSRHTGGQKGYEFERQRCCECGRRIAVSMDPDGRTVWMRPHANRSTGRMGDCPRRQPRTEMTWKMKIRVELARANPALTDAQLDEAVEQMYDLAVVAGKRIRDAQ